MLLLAAAAFVCYGGTRMTRLGFYHDDWAILSLLHFSPPDLPSRCAALTRGITSLLFRPLEIPLYAGLYALFGLNPLPWQLALLGVNAALAAGVRRLLLAYGVSARLALLGALVFLAFPSKDATMFWPIVIVNSLALLMFLSAYLLHLDYVKTGRPMSLGGAAALLLLCLATYDQCFFLAALWAVAPGPLNAEARARRRRGATVGACVTAAFAVYKFWIVPQVFSVPYNKTIVLSAARFLSVYRDGLAASLGPATAAYAAKAAWSALRLSPLVAAAAIILPWLLLAEDDPDAAPPGGRPLIGLGIGIFVLGYLPIAVSNYIPTPFNHMNRINQVPALGLVLAAVGASARGKRRTWPAVLGCALAALLLSAHVAFADAWARSYQEQLRVRDLIISQARQWPAGATLLLLMPETFIEGKAPIFLEHWDITGAARIWTEDPARTADVITERTDFFPEGVALRPGSPRLPYASVRLLETRRGLFTPVGFHDFQRVRYRTSP